MMSIKKSFIILTICFSAMMGLGLYFFYCSMSLASGFTAFVSVEHRWAQSEKATAYHLVQYVLSSNPNEFNNFLRAQKISMGLRQARTEFVKENSDFNSIARVVNPASEDLPLLQDASKLLSTYGHQGNLKKAFERWTEGDNKLALLEDVASELHNDVLRNELNAEKKDYYLARISRLNEDFSVAEKDFASAISEAQKNFDKSLSWFSILIFSGLSLIGALAAFALTKKVLQNLKSLTESIEKMRSGSYDVSLSVSANEDRALISAFKDLSEELLFNSRDHERAMMLAGLGLWKWNIAEQKMSWSKKIYDILNIPSDQVATYEAFRGRIHPEDRAIFDNLLKKETFSEFKILPVEIRLVGFGSEGWRVRYYKFLVEVQSLHGKTFISGAVQENSERKHLPEKAS